MKLAKCARCGFVDHDSEMWGVDVQRNGLERRIPSVDIHEDLCTGCKEAVVEFMFKKVEK